MKQYLSYAHRELQFNGNLGVFLRSLIFRQIGHVHVKNVLRNGIHGREEGNEGSKEKETEKGRKGGRMGWRKTKRKKERREQERKQNRIMVSFQEWSHSKNGPSMAWERDCLCIQQPALQPELMS